MLTTERVDHIESITTDFNGESVTEDHTFVNDIGFVSVGGGTTKDISFVSGAEAVKNIVEAVANTCRGELAMDVTKGLPYFESVFGMKSEDDIANWVAYFNKEVSEANGVEAITSFSYENTVDSRDRRGLAYTVKFKTAYGDAEVSNVNEE